LFLDLEAVPLGIKNGARILLPLKD